jgi:riboflavin synthase
MFTGIVEEIGRIERFDGQRMRIAATTVLEDAHIGDSIAVNGCCLTVVSLDDGAWEADLSAETVQRTAFGNVADGHNVNLERAVMASQRLGGHIVQGHVDAVGVVVEPVPDLAVQVPSDLVRYLVEKGSVTVNGVSLTVVDIVNDVFTVAVIPHTAEVTTLGALQSGDRVNLEADVIAKYVEQMLAPHRQPASDNADPQGAL